MPVISEQKLRHFTCDSGKIKYGKPELRSWEKWLKDKCSNKWGNLQTRKHTASDRKNTPNASSSNSSSHKFNRHCSAGPNYPTAQNFTYEFTRIRLLTPNVASIKGPSWMYLFFCALLVPWGECSLWSIPGEVLKACGYRSIEACVRSTDHLVMVGSMCMCNHDVESTQEGCLHKCCSDMRWPGLFDEVRLASWQIYLSICKYWLHLRKMGHFLNLCKVRSLSIHSPFFCFRDKIL